jgi:hypothetical protein
MATAGKVYTGPDIALWRRLVLRHAWHFAGTLIAFWGVMVAGVAGWHCQDHQNLPVP